MKKIKMMRLASVLLVAVLLTTCVISGTFAKYVTSDSSSDSARVAKWGISITTSGNLFGLNYKDAIIADSSDTTITVASSDTTKVVAPGTKNETGMTFTIGGKAEVDLQLNVAVEATDITLAANTYDDPTTGNATDKFTLSTAYHPVKFTLTKNGTAEKTGVALSEIETYLEALSGKVEANQALGSGTSDTDTYVLTWAWDFEDSSDTNIDKADTYLGNETTLQTLSFAITITATQID